MGFFNALETSSVCGKDSDWISKSGNLLLEIPKILNVERNSVSRRVMDGDLNQKTYPVAI